MNGAACIPNIGPAQRRHRLRLGIAAWIVGAVALAALLALDAGRGWRILLALPFWAGAIGFLQHRDKT